MSLVWQSVSPVPSVGADTLDRALASPSGGRWQPPISREAAVDGGPPRANPHLVRPRIGSDPLIAPARLPSFRAAYRRIRTVLRLPPQGRLSAARPRGAHRAELCHCEPVTDVTGVAIRFPRPLRRGRHPRPCSCLPLRGRWQPPISREAAVGGGPPRANPHRVRFHSPPNCINRINTVTIAQKSAAVKRRNSYDFLHAYRTAFPVRYRRIMSYR